MAKSKNATKPKITEANLRKGRDRLATLDKQIKELTEERYELRFKMADYFLPEKEKDHGSATIKVHGVAVKVTRKKTISCNKEQQAEFAAEDPERFEEIFPKKTVREMNETLARNSLKEIDAYVTSKQGLPTVEFKDLEEDAS